ncbi:response regulator transcription factor [Paraburkholderia aromaticivorans]|uniref:response regulator transcription factor n=1 Tax=Paraburkholderia aromaticivorans TaxID=2026199 RepID=UPI0023F68D45|nr:response regulator transcription factor [Paraburkholderia aromaticivorans]
MRVLIYERDNVFAKVLREALRARSYAVDWVDNARHAELALASDFYDAILFCIEGQQNSLSILKDYRAAGHTTSVVAFTARHSVAERTLAFDAGADICLEKPVDTVEVMVWLRALMRRRAGQLKSVVSHGPIMLDDAAGHVLVDGAPISLKAKEYAILRIFFTEPRRFFTASYLEEKIYGWGEEVKSNAVQVHVHSLRKKLGNHCIETRHGAGYRLSDSTAPRRLRAPNHPHLAGRAGEDSQKKMAAS